MPQAPNTRRAVQTAGISSGNPLADSYTRQWLAGEGFDLSKPTSWADEGATRVFTQDEAPPRPLLKAGAFKRVTA